ncbi:hypothetical protein BX661DRAFT_178286 [Kickxella alabastrina]|uniref:uncharacterized protein n=1 Tax=Kickxella alabastrina TaxID=61397 RepID=UPI00221E745F|nr:uncharacterized protein BX661DRAFT_178286 [Kickxella alabastrina]KAI7833374.1 hypothetical protein BX661DRAFT_178286 [Kickxella alabastrina]
MDGYVDKISRVFSDSRMQLVTTAVAASAVTASVMWGTRQVQRKKRVRDLKKTTIEMQEFDELHSASQESLSAEVTKQTPISLSSNEEALIREQLARHYAFLGDAGMEKVRGGFVVVVGAGGVGSWAAMMLVRSGVQRIRVVDFDQVTLSSLNRHAAATRANVGISKVEALRMSFADIAPHVCVDARVALFSAANAAELLDGQPDMVLDCIDNMDTKIDLLAYCKANKIKVISAMGAGMKADPSRVQIADISDTFEDPMSRAVRRRLKARGILSGIPVVYSTEKPGKVQLVSLADSQTEAPGDFSVLPDFRVRIVPVLGTMPALFGIAMATNVLTELAGFPTEPLAIKGRHALYARMQRELGTRESKVPASAGGPMLQMSVDDVGYMLEEIWRGRSAVSGSTDRLVLTRWHREKPMSTGNCISLTRAEADKHDALECAPEDYYSPEIVAFIERRLAEERHLSTMR